MTIKAVLWALVEEQQGMQFEFLGFGNVSHVFFKILSKLWIKFLILESKIQTDLLPETHEMEENLYWAHREWAHSLLWNCFNEDI